MRYRLNLILIDAACILVISMCIVSSIDINQQKAWILTLVIWVSFNFYQLMTAKGRMI